MIGFGIVGTGGMAARMAGVIAASDEAQVIHVASGSSTQRASDFAATHGIKVHSDLAALLGDPDVAAVYVAGRNRDHAAVSLSALGAGKAVFCEKPFACSLPEAEAVIAAARAAKLLYMEAMATPYLPAVAEAMARVRLGEFGAIRHVEASFGYPVDRTAAPGLFADDAGIMRDRMVYPVTLAVLLLGPPTLQQVVTLSEDAVRICCTHADGAQSDVAASFVERLANRLVIACEKRTVTVAAPLLSAQRLFVGSRMDRSGTFAQNQMVRRAGDAVARLRGNWRPFGSSPYAPELAHFCAMLREGRLESPVFPHRAMLDVQRVIAR